MSTATTEVPLQSPPLIAPTPPKDIHLRVIIQGEVDQLVPGNVDKDTLARAIANDVKTKSPSFKITRILIAEGIGPVIKPL